MQLEERYEEIVALTKSPSIDALRVNK